MKGQRSVLVSLLVMMSVAGCSSAPKTDFANSEERVFIENSLGTKSRPDWLQTSSVSEEKGSDLYFKGTYLALGNDRLSTCYRLAEADIQVRLSQEINNQIKSELLQLAEGTSEQLQPAILDSLLVESRARLQGLRVVDRYYERAVVRSQERVECSAQARISKQDFQRSKDGITEQLATKRPEIRAILDKRQKDFARTEEAMPEKTPLPVKAEITEVDN